MPELTFWYDVHLDFVSFQDYADGYKREASKFQHNVLFIKVWSPCILSDEFVFIEFWEAVLRRTQIIWDKYRMMMTMIKIYIVFIFIVFFLTFFDFLYP